MKNILLLPVKIWKLKDSFWIYDLDTSLFHVLKTEKEQRRSYKPRTIHNKSTWKILQPLLSIGLAQDISSWAIKQLNGSIPFQIADVCIDSKEIQDLFLVHETLVHDPERLQSLYDILSASAVLGEKIRRKKNIDNIQAEEILGEYLQNKQNELLEKYWLLPTLFRMFDIINNKPTKDLLHFFSVRWFQLAEQLNRWMSKNEKWFNFLNKN